MARTCAAAWAILQSGKGKFHAQSHSVQSRYGKFLEVIECHTVLATNIISKAKRKKNYIYIPDWSVMW